MNRAMVLAAVLLTACSSPTPGGPNSSTGSYVGIQLKGTMAVDRWSSAGFQGAGFLDLAGGGYASDPNAALAQAGVLQKTVIQPVLFGSASSGFDQVTYDPAAHRWVPVSRAQIAPDGLSYAYAEWLYPPPPDPSQCLHGCLPEPTGGRIHVADPRSGQDTVVYKYAGWPAYNVVALVPGAIYLGGVCNGSAEPGCDRLSRLDVATGTTSLVSGQTGQQWHLHGSDMWLVTTDYARLLRVGLRDGTMATWLTKDFSDSMELIGFDGAGVPLVVLASHGPAPVFAVTSPGNAV
ncbi:MAG TPA: hypothetical protein VGG31_08445, partial [Candidatus Dormibacteraeota bacterium]